MHDHKKKSVFKAGMYLLETLTSGMYNEPLSIYREYIQNAVDSIDMVRQKRTKKQIQIEVDLDPILRRIRIIDAGIGIPANVAERVLSSIGSSDKTGEALRGFRGIGRLGGLAFSEKARYRTKSCGETIETIQEWNCRKMREILSDEHNSNLTLKDLFKSVTRFEQMSGERKTGSYFEVTLEGVSSFRNYVFDVRKVKDYLSQVAPVPFNSESFSHGEKVENYLRSKLSSYSCYTILLNGEPICKPYKETVKVTKQGADYIDDVKLLEIQVKDQSVAYGWYGIRRDFLGSIVKGDISSGIRLRVGNILLGDSHLLDGCFRESRFNGYMIGEIHVEHPALLPNSRRDDFVDNDMKTLFYNALERDIGVPISKEIRYRSRTCSHLKANSLKRGAKQKRPARKDPSRNGEGIPSVQLQSLLRKMPKTCRTCSKLHDALLEISSH